MVASGQLSRPCHFTTRKREPVTRWIGGCVDPTAGLDAVLKRKIPSPCRDSNPRSPALYHWANRAPV